MVSKNIGISGTSPLTVALLVLSGCLLSETVSAQLLYCCEVKGRRTCGDALPPQCIGLQYTVRGPGGRLVKSVEAPLSPEQLRAREEIEKRKKEEEIARKEQSRLDAALLATYSTEAEIDKGRERMEAEYSVSIKAAEGRIAAAQKRKQMAIGDPELYKKRGMPDDLKRQIQDIDFEIRSQNDLVDSKKKDLEAARAKFNEDRQRYLDLKARRGNKP